MFLYLYDAANRLLQAGNVSFTYDNNGNTISKTDADGRGEQTISIYVFNNPINAIDPLGLLFIKTCFSGDIHIGGGVAVSFCFMQELGNGWNRGIQICFGVGLGGGAGATFTSTIATGNLDPGLDVSAGLSGTAVAAWLGGAMKEANGDITTYEYDKLYRLTKIVYPDGRTVTYTYDPVGNRLSMNDNGNVINYTYDAANRLLQAGNVTFAYDNNGNTISKTDTSGITNYQYDYENRLIGITYPDGLTNSFAYSPDGKRIKKVNSNGTTYYLLDRENVLQELNNEGATKAQYVTTLTIDDLISRIAEGSAVYYHKDGLGSVTALTDADQNLVTTYKYDAFGTVIAQTGTVISPYKFTSREFDSDSGFYYYRLRYYNSQVGRFITKDPLSFSIRRLPITNFNPYFYVYNNPINYVDPLGAVGIGGGPSFSLCYPKLELLV